MDSVVSENIQRFLEENPQVAQTLIRKAVQASRAREAARKARDDMRTGKKRSESSNLNGKLTPAQSKDFTRNELFIVEGDSAGVLPNRDVTRRFRLFCPSRKTAQSGKIEAGGHSQK